MISFRLKNSPIQNRRPQVGLNYTIFELMNLFLRSTVFYTERERKILCKSVGRENCKMVKACGSDGCFCISGFDYHENDDLTCKKGVLILKKDDNKLLTLFKCAHLVITGFHAWKKLEIAKITIITNTPDIAL